MTDYLTADAAKRITLVAKALFGEYLREETIEVLNLVAAAAKRGCSWFVWRDAFCCSEIIRNRLVALGYKVFYTAGYNDCYPRLEISW